MTLELKGYLIVFKTRWSLSVTWNQKSRCLTLYKGHKPVLNMASKDPQGFRPVGGLKHCWFGGLFEWELGMRG